MANRLDLKVNDTVQALFESKSSNLKFKQRKPIITGIYNTGFEEFDKTMVIGDLREVQKINKWGK